MTASLDEAGSNFALDAPASINTVFYLLIGDNAYGESDFSGDLDVYYLRVDPGSRYSIVAGDTTLGFTTPINLYDRNGYFLTTSVDRGTFSGLSFTATDSLYYVGLLPSGPGIYSMRVGNASIVENNETGQDLVPGQTYSAAPDYTSDSGYYLFTPPSLATLQSAFQFIMREDPITGVNASKFNVIAALYSSGAINQDQGIRQIIALADASTSVATLAYQFFTGKIPSAGGIDFLVAPTGPNPNNLNSAYYQSFSLENRYINFAVNLGKLGEGKDAFAASYGSKTLAEATSDAYTKIFGSTPTAAKVSALLDPSFVLNGQTLTRAEYFAFYGQDGLSGIGTKAAMVGWLLGEAVKADIGTYAKSNDAFLLDLADGATFAVDLVGTYGKPEFAFTG
jgi:hypothetical protein